MIVVIEKNNKVMLQKEYHILSQEQMKNFLEEKNCHHILSKDFAQESFSKKLEDALNSDNDDRYEKEYEVIHVWLN